MQGNKPVLIVGLGNPGAEYSRTRHNVGFIATEYIAGPGATWKTEHGAQTTRMEIDGHNAIIARPMSFMNNSGVPVSALMAYYKIPLENLVVIHDDMDLPTGDVREKVGGGSAGHNGIRSIDAHIGREYRRIRIGIAHPRDIGLPIDPADWVLGRFTEAEYAAIMDAISHLQLI